MCCALATNVSRLWAFAMSALPPNAGHQSHTPPCLLWAICRHSASINRMSAYPPKADIRATHRHVRFGPILLKKSAVALGEIR